MIVVENQHASLGCDVRAVPPLGRKQAWSAIIPCRPDKCFNFFTDRHEILLRLRAHSYCQHFPSMKQFDPPIASFRHKLMDEHKWNQFGWAGPPQLWRLLCSFFNAWGIRLVRSN